MKSTIPLGRIDGIRLGAHWSVLVMVALMAPLVATNVLPAIAPNQPSVRYWLAGFAVAVVFLASLLAHELSHALIARHCGLRARRITLWLLGGATELGGDPATPRAEGLIAAAGPVISLLLGGAFLLGASAAVALGLGTVVVASLIWLALANLVLGVFNLLPGAPLDGGRILRAALWKHYGDRARANRVAVRAGRMLGFGIAVLGFVELVATGDVNGIWFVVLGWFIAAAAIVEGNDVAAAGTGLDEIRAHHIMTTAPVTVPGWWTVDAMADAMRTQPPRHRLFPVVDFAGPPVGVISIAKLATVPPQRRVVSDDRLAGLITPADLARTVELTKLTGHGTVGRSRQRIGA